jgi:FkbM family methyltransferase
MKYKDHDQENVAAALEERILECSGSYPLPREVLKVAVDIGANIGGFSIHASKSFQKIVAIEANPDSVECFKNNIKERNISNVEIHALAVSDIKGKMINLYKIDEADAAHSGNCGTEWDKSSSYQILETEEVPTTDLEEIFSLCGESYIDYLKIDCEGAEYNFLMDKDLKNVGFIVGEYHPGVVSNLDGLWSHIRKTHKLQVSPNHLFFAVPL